MSAITSDQVSDETLKLLADQPAMYPRCQRGYEPSAGRPRPGKDLHLFVFRPVTAGSTVGTLHAACDLSGHGQVLHDDQRRLRVTRSAARCGLCTLAHVAAQEAARSRTVTDTVRA